ncbi:uncharacterized protein BXZ73DRAFT_106997 [Epithele typhae]|uniref:uncharacterized protein n=1 Tax=Epithele typhae TaxID=378194 RepID=UPI00200844B9|nr:uncharacterized protein BXZ73DRAFT_106997 [Epithele typhae]KAH9913352.1 hypothetical protein BXZ73DRAFT_106997 [Epithele typhae]
MTPDPSEASESRPSGAKRRVGDRTPSPDSIVLDDSQPPTSTETVKAVQPSSKRPRRGTASATNREMEASASGGSRHPTIVVSDSDSDSVGDGKNYVTDESSSSSDDGGSDSSDSGDAKRTTRRKKKSRTAKQKAKEKRKKKAKTMTASSKAVSRGGPTARDLQVRFAKRYEGLTPEATLERLLAVWDSPYYEHFRMPPEIEHNHKGEVVHRFFCKA